MENYKCINNNRYFPLRYGGTTAARRSNCKHITILYVRSRYRVVSLDIIFVGLHNKQIHRVLHSQGQDKLPIYCIGGALTYILNAMTLIKPRIDQQRCFRFQFYSLDFFLFILKSFQFSCLFMVSDSRV